MDITEAFAPGGGSEDLAKTDFFDFVVSPAPHGTSGDAVSDEEGFLHRTSCRSIGVSFLHDSRQDSHDSRHDIHSSSFVKETNNNTLTALPPVSTITGSLNHHHHHHHHHRNHICAVQNQDITMQPPDCDYWGDDGKEQTCSILLEDLSKYCWSTTTNSPSQSHGGDSLVQGETTTRGCAGSASHRQNTDGAIYTLTVLNNDANSMDALDCCKSPAPTSTDSWSLRPNLDLDAILSLDPSGDHDHDSVPETSRNDRFHVLPVVGMGSQYSADDSGFVESKEMCVRSGQTPGSGDNNNDWKLSDQNHLTDNSSTPGGDSAESLLRSALQGKLYSGTTAQVVSSSSSNTSQTSTLALQNATGNPPHVQIMTDHQTDETMHPCTEEDLLLSQLDATTYRPGDYEKLKSIANEVVESYCSLEPVCNVSATTTVMYTLDPASGSLGTITLPADLSQVSTVTVVTTGQQDPVINQGAVRQEAETAPSQIQISPPRAASTASTKPAKKYIRRVNRNGSNGGGGSGGTASTNGAQNQGSGGSPGSVQRKERSLHYCSICSKGFKDKYSVNVHIRTHTGEKPFACSLCGKSFRQKAHLAKHYQTHVAQKPTNVGTGATTSPSAQTTNPVQATPTNGSNNTGSNNNNNNNNNINNNNNNNNQESEPTPTQRNQTHVGAEQATSCNTTTS